MKLNKTIKFEGSSVFYDVFGSGQNTVVLLHGFLESSFIWERIINGFSNDYQIICIDLLGHGQSTNVGDIHTMTMQADMVFEVLDHENIDTFYLVGHSMGGYVGLSMLEQSPHKIKKLMLLNSTPVSDSEERIELRNRNIGAVKENLVLTVGLSVANLFSEVNRELLKNNIEIVKQKARQTSLQGIIAAQEGMKLRCDYSNLIKHTTVPIALVLGIDDPIMNYNDTKIFADYDHVNLISLEGGHMSWLENPVGLSHAMSDFLGI